MFRVAAVAGIVIGLLLASVSAAETGSPVAVPPVFQADFDGPAALMGWTPSSPEGVRLVPGRAGGEALCVELPAAGGPGHRNARRRLPVEELRGKRLRVRAMIKAEGVAPPPNPWNGVKCMVHTAGPPGPRWMQHNLPGGSFDWRKVEFIAEVPADATEAWLHLGLEQTTGTAWFDDVSITVVGGRRKPGERPAGPVYKGHALARLRGAMISPQVTEADLRVFGGQWKANHVRWQLLWGGFPKSPADRAEPREYREWLESALAHLDRLLPVCEEVGLHVVVDLHTPPGGRNEASECRMFHEQRFQDEFMAVWESIVRRYRGNRTVWGYDLVNEPVEGAIPDGLMDWHALATATARKVRAIDPDHAIIVEPEPWGSPEGLDWFEPLDVPGVVYSVHMYVPHQFTHQGVYENPTGVSYPGEIQGKHWDKAALRRVLQPAIDYQRDYGVHIYIGEFSAIRWAPGDSAYNYLRDCIDIFEENDWDWAYHAFREWDGWSVEHGPDRAVRTPSLVPTRRQELLRSWYSKNQPTGGRP